MFFILIGLFFIHVANVEGGYEKLCDNPNDWRGNTELDFSTWPWNGGKSTCDAYAAYLSGLSSEIDLSNPTCAMFNIPVTHSSGVKVDNLRDDLRFLKFCCGGDMTKLFSVKKMDSKFAHAPIRRFSSIRFTCFSYDVPLFQNYFIDQVVKGRNDNERFLSEQLACGPLKYETRVCHDHDGPYMLQIQQTCKTALCNEYIGQPKTFRYSKDVYDRVHSGKCYMYDYTTDGSRGKAAYTVEDPSGSEWYWPCDAVVSSSRSNGNNNSMILMILLSLLLFYLL